MRFTLPVSRPDILDRGNSISTISPGAMSGAHKIRGDAPGVSRQVMPMSGENVCELSEKLATLELVSTVGPSSGGVHSMKVKPPLSWLSQLPTG